MALLARCWLIIECIVTPDGFVKWFYLSFYIDPFFLFFCQIFLWIKTLQRWITLFLFLPLRYLLSFVLRVLRHFLIITRLFAAGCKYSTAEVEEEELWYEVSDSFSPSDTEPGMLFLEHYKVCSRETPKIGFWAVEPDLKVGSVAFGQETISACSSFTISDEETCLEESSSPVYGSSSQHGYFSSASHSDMEESSFSLLPSALPTCTSHPLPITEEDHELIAQRKEKETDSFYKTYAERMNWFDLLNQERTRGISAILNKKQYLGREKRILKSLESDVEMVYVAQSCLSWEALFYQYKKLEAIIAFTSEDSTCTSTSSYGSLCSGAIAAKFQKFQILLERFMEDERCDEGKRYWNFVQKRSSLNSLLQVPEVSVEENMDEGKERRKGELMIRTTDVLLTIEKCIKAFWLFVKLDTKEPWWRARNSLSWAPSPLEDPRDISLLHDLTHTLRKKELRMKDLKGKKRCWLRKSEVNPCEDESQKKEMMFAMIELKLVSRVLMMSMISTSQLQWCQQKLNNIQFSEGKIIRPCMVSFLFPPS